MSGRLSNEEVEFFQRQGYLVLSRPVFPQAKFDALKDHFEEKLETWTQEGGGQSPEHMDVPHFTDTRLFAWLFADEVLDLAEPLVGPDIALWSSHFISKPPGVGKRVPWHEDSAYWGRVLDPMEVVTLWLAIDPSTPENGCLRVIPGSHRSGDSGYRPVSDPEASVFATEIRPGQLDESQAVDIVLRPNECSIHHARLIHGSNPNRSATRRCGYTMRYVPTTSRFRPETYAKAFQIYLARGRDQASNRYGDPTEVNEAWVAPTTQERRRVHRLSG